ncbi:uncharacterized protein BYT42DRAFT_539300 [Radiomyces spectabilis]|uniref:uncharacterized protein n=1 Tax=Radiomyces spectabilis TaxID=64574 RepID=UPI0022205D29|nr:uncharacterized protein BYT42DRAFT_539300 [Radiomyces spectabilis]KAI8368173.1 hypothetical protein BYT42DRAFT_539300 [Radiomyces spectabilis]
MAAATAPAPAPTDLYGKVPALQPSTFDTAQSPASSNSSVTDKDSTGKKKKGIRQAVGIIVIDPATKKVLMLSSRKQEGALRLPRGQCNRDTQEQPEAAALRVLHEEAGVSTNGLNCRVGTYTEANKKGNIIAHHWMYEVHASTLMDTWPASDRQRFWVSYKDALLATADRRMAHLALTNCSLAHN